MRIAERPLRRGGLRPPPSFILSGDMIDAPSAHPYRLRRRGGYHPPSSAFSWRSNWQPPISREADAG